jgi:hypothetical protein
MGGARFARFPCPQLQGHGAPGTWVDFLGIRWEVRGALRALPMSPTAGTWGTRDMAEFFGDLMGGKGRATRASHVPDYRDMGHPGGVEGDFFGDSMGGKGRAARASHVPDYRDMGHPGGVEGDFFGDSMGGKGRASRASHVPDYRDMGHPGHG